jgi:hypothetical protein
MTLETAIAIARLTLVLVAILSAAFLTELAISYLLRRRKASKAEMESYRKASDTAPNPNAPGAAGEFGP